MRTMVTPNHDVEVKLKRLERQVALLASALGEAIRNGWLELRPQDGQPPPASSSPPIEGVSAPSPGRAEAGECSNGQPTLCIQPKGRGHLHLASERDVSLQAAESLRINALSVRVESPRVDIDGELSACLRQSEQFEWQSGQAPVKLVHQTHGIPVLTALKGKFRSRSSGIRMYVDPDDGYWYLSGENSQGAEISAQVTCIGRV